MDLNVNMNMKNDYKIPGLAHSLVLQVTLESGTCRGYKNALSLTPIPSVPRSIVTEKVRVSQ